MASEGAGPVRAAFVGAAQAARGLVAAPAVAAAWEAPSALPRLSVGGLAAHLGRAVLLVPQYLDGAPPQGEPIPAEAYIALLLASPDPDAPLNVEVRERAEAAARDGHRALLEALDGALARLRGGLAGEPPDRTVAVRGGLVMRLDDYLLTRLVELVVHADDLVVSVGARPPAWPAGVEGLVIGHLVAVARRRHGDLAVLRALARRERDAVQALRVL